MPGSPLAPQTVAQPVAAPRAVEPTAEPTAENKPWTPASAPQDTRQGEYGDYGHLVDLSVELGRQTQEPSPPDGFIKDPRRRTPTAMPSPLANTPSSAGPAKTLNVPVVVKAGDVKAGTTIRIVLELRVEP